MSDERKCPHHPHAPLARLDTEWERCKPVTGAACKFTRKVEKKRKRR